jgi:hypothetical protein
MLTTRLGNLKPLRVLLRLQNSSKIVRATPKQIASLADVMVSRDPVDNTWVSTSSDKSEEFGTILVQE